MTTPVLNLEKVRKTFGSEVVLEDITFTVPVHTATVFIGASGSGKSTLLRCINLLDQIMMDRYFLMARTFLAQM